MAQAFLEPATEEYGRALGPAYHPVVRR